MTTAIRSRFRPFREEAEAQGVPADDVERWLATARPCATLTLSDDDTGPLVGRFGGPLLLPSDTPDPGHPFVASVDLVALPADATDLLLPSDGRLLFFAGSELVEIWEDTKDLIAPSAQMQMGGYADEESVEFDPVDVAASLAAQAVDAGHWDGPVSDDVADRVLLADWYAGRDVEKREGATVHWVIQREDLAARRFERVFTTVFWNP
ncbi:MULTISPECIES: hypothetical protein [Streptomyces]|uniref:DUF1963 domain-containing protein n=1 Tax=Streptomyces silvae TaxID=2803812 RepID=A0ABU8AAH2_9ACTN|nr:MULTISPECIES: hypothetical protein [unclassified Streptomyces]MDX3325945.1 hypothetical protein [Streptomyces sp. ME02-6979-3A]